MLIRIRIPRAGRKAVWTWIPAETSSTFLLRLRRGL